MRVRRAVSIHEAERSIRFAQTLFVVAVGAIASSASAQTLFTTHVTSVPVVHISRDGSTIAGWGVEVDVAGGLVWIEPADSVETLSGDGSIRVLRHVGPENPVIDDNGVATPMPDPPLPYDTPRVVDISGDGNTLAGHVAIGGSGLVPMLYDRPSATYTIFNPTLQLAPGTEITLQFAIAEAISTDGSTTVGLANVPVVSFPAPPIPEYDAMRVDANGNAEFLGVLDLIPGTYVATATAVSADGSTITGWISEELTYIKAWIWQDGVPSLLGFEGEPTAITSNGYRIVGRACFPALTCVGAAFDGAAYWTPDTGLRSVEEELETTYGVDLGGWTLSTVEDISDDGMTMVGRGSNEFGAKGLWAVQLDAPVEIAVPEPGFAIGLTSAAIGLVLGARRRRR